MPPPLDAPRPLRHVVFRADATRATGAGHAMRCFALAEAVVTHGAAITWVTAASTDAWAKARWRALGSAVVEVDAPSGSDADADATLTALEAGAGDGAWLVVDHYGLDASWRRRVRASGVPLLVLDDAGTGPVAEADLIVNPNAHGAAAPYGSPALAGGRYALLRREIVEATGSGTHGVVVAFGGSDEARGTELALGALRDRTGVTVVVGGSNARVDELRRVVAANASWRLAVDPPELPALLANAGLALASGGTTALELCVLGVPTVVVTTADNQVPGAQALEARGAILLAGAAGSVTAEELARVIGRVFADPAVGRELSLRGRELIDGLGARRVAQRMAGSAFTLRRVRTSDVELLFRWTNDPTVRGRSFQRAPIPWSDHTAWFERKRADPGCLLLIAEDDAGAPLGQIRFDVERGASSGPCGGLALASGRAQIGLSLDAAHRGRGLAPELIRRGVAEARVRGLASSFVARVRCGNASSRAAFLRAGFTVSASEGDGDDAVETLHYAAGYDRD